MTKLTMTVATKAASASPPCLLPDYNAHYVNIASRQTQGKGYFVGRFFCVAAMRAIDGRQIVKAGEHTGGKYDRGRAGGKIGGSGAGAFRYLSGGKLNPQFWRSEPPALSLLP